MSFIIETTIDGVTHGVIPKDGKFQLMPLIKTCDVDRVMHLPQLSLARNLVSWINENDKELSNFEFNVSPTAKYG